MSKDLGKYLKGISTVLKVEGAIALKGHRAAVIHPLYAGSAKKDGAILLISLV